MQTLSELIPQMRSLGRREAVLLDDGYRRRSLTYEQLHMGIQLISHRFQRDGLRRSDRLILWGENSPEWICAFWASVQLGVEVVAVDARSSSRFVSSVIEETEASLLLYGSSIDQGELSRSVPSYSFRELGNWVHEGLNRSRQPRFEARDLSPDDVVEIVYTSGTTGRPKGVPHRHKNLCANLRPFRREIEKHSKLAYPFQPIRILNMLPLSHMFGQSMGLFIPLFLKGTVCFTPELRPSGIADLIRRNRISVLVVVPRLLRQMREYLENKYDLCFEVRRSGVLGIAERWWKARVIHRRFGWKFWAVVIGGAAVKAEMEEFWSKLGILPVQGYGLTEASPVVAVNHPFSAKKGSLGKVVRGQDVRIARDGEILVRGESIVTQYLSKDAEGEAWLHTGDLGEIDDEGRLYYKGRKKDLIVTSEGRNVHPEEVEEALNRQPGVRDCAVIGLEKEGDETVHAVLLLESSGADPGAFVKAANVDLEPEQRVRSWSVWPHEDLPRTPSTMKVKRAEVARIVREEQDRERESESVRPDSSLDFLASLLGKFSSLKSSEMEDQMRLSEDLGISSLDQIEILSRLEEHYSVALSERDFTEISTVRELREVIFRSKAQESKDLKKIEAQSGRKGSSAEDRDHEGATGTGKARRESSEYRQPRWTRSAPIRGFRWLSHEALIVPLFRHYIELSVEGIEALPEPGKPVIFVANHASHLDTVAVYAALPRRWRYRLAPAIRKEYFAPYLNSSRSSLRKRSWYAVQYFLSGILFNVYPIPQRMGGIREALAYTGELLDQGYCPLVYPEGKRTPNGEMIRFQPGIGLMAVRLQVSVVPLYLDGLFEIFSLHENWPSRGALRARIGCPLRFGEAGDYREVAKEIEEAVRSLGSSS